MIVKPIPTTHCAQAWFLVEKHFEEACKFGDEYTLEQIKGLILTGQWMLLVASDEQGAIHGAAAVNFTNMPNSRVAYVMAIGGKLISNQDTYKQMVDIFKQFGATKIQGAARESIARLWRRYGFEEKYRIVEVSI
jgi:hypothetical protein